MRICFIEILEHHSIKTIFLIFYVTGKFQTEANYAIKVKNQCFDTRCTHLKLPMTLYLQMNICNRENINRFLSSYSECLIARKAFDKAQLSFSPVGHTHEDISQAFSATSQRLKSYSVFTLTEQHKQLQSY